MLENAREQGVKAFEGVRVLEVLFDGERATGARIIAPEGDIREIMPMSWSMRAVKAR